ncbi:DNA-binding transcriptional LysR family regulator [Thermocatellispora tengchongensis]|uniref:DNA-binding transcriptional LysR family regulator n=1 Tax=Thermocatellispora tengchongensis TaxID=1073253 RepID=A0A840P4C2_9ACTN|nr:LysR family transcriptional regulator [Thermocatellispora tengchongensis]MBB5133356.1 DNA-binding transcriptional LysR family regulator [Thermocatellispora tengchongensis]
MDVQQLRYFVAVAEELHFGRAAERLHVTSSPLSRRIRELERELGRELFDRRHHRVELTPFGRTFLEPARDVLARFDALPRLAAPAPQAPPAPPVVRVGATPLAPTDVLDLVLETFEKVSPGAGLPLTLEPSAGLLALMAARKLDIAVVHLPVRDPGLRALALAEYRFAVAMRPGDPLAGRAELTVGDLAGREMLLPSPKVHPLVMNGLREHLRRGGVTRLRELPHNDVVQIAAHVAHSRALALATPGTLRGRVLVESGLVLVPLDDPDLRFRLGVVWPEGAEAHGGPLAEAIAVLRDRALAP